MKKEDKELLKKVICSMLPYGVKGKVETTDGNGKDIKDDGVLNNVFINEYGKVYICIEGMEYELDDFKPYLRTMSSMTVVERKDLRRLTDAISIYNDGLEFESHDGYNDYIGYCFCSEIVDWLNAHHFDYSGLIPMGLALEAPEGMYKTKQDIDMLLDIIKERLYKQLKFYVLDAAVFLLPGEKIILNYTGCKVTIESTEIKNAEEEQICGT